MLPLAPGDPGPRDDSAAQAPATDHVRRVSREHGVTLLGLDPAKDGGLHMPNSQTEGRPPGDALTGPVFVEGAAPGDTLVVEVLAIEQDGPGERGRAAFPTSFALMLGGDAEADPLVHQLRRVRWMQASSCWDPTAAWSTRR